MVFTRLLLALVACWVAVALPAGRPHAESLRPEEPEVEERPRDLPSWILASRLGRSRKRWLGRKPIV